MAQNLKALIGKRAVFKSHATRFERFLTNENPDPVEVDVRLRKFQPILSEFEQVQADIEVAQGLEEIDDDERAQFEDLYFSLVAKATAIVSSYERPDSPNQGSSSSLRSHRSATKQQVIPPVQMVKLPQIQLPTFHGDYSLFISFRESFQSLIGKREDLDNIQKFHYLKSSLFGEACQVISALEISHNNYSVAWQLLNERFQNKRLVVTRHLKSLFEVEKIEKESAVKLRNLIDNSMKHIRALESMELPVNHWDIPIIHILSSKLDYKTLRQWESLCDKDSFPTVNRFMGFLQTQATVLETMEHPRTSKPTNQKLQSSHVASDPQSSNKSSVSPASQLPKCQICSYNHQVYNCRKFLSSSIDNRLSMVAKAGLCPNCLRGKHLPEKCFKGPCPKCSAKHNSLLHTDQATNNAALEANDDNISAGQEHETVFHSVSATQRRKATIMLSTAIIKVNDSKNRPQHCRVLLDSGSQINCITERMAQVLGIPMAKKSSSICGIGGAYTNGSKALTCRVSSLDNNFNCCLEFIVMPKITLPIPTFDVDVSRWEIPPQIQLADPSFNKRSHIDMLIGAAEFFNIIGAGQIPLGPELPILQWTKLGWVVVGQLGSNFATSDKDTFTQQGCFVSLEETMSRFWEIEEISVNREFNPEEQACENNFLSTTKRYLSGRFEVQLPIKSNINQLGNSKDIALKRFLSLEHKLLRNPTLKQAYSTFMREYISLNHMQLVLETEEPKLSYYVPHHAVMNEHSSTTKLRVVFDGSCKSDSGTSLNDALMTGPSVQEDLFSIILRFRKHRYVITSDITKMYRQINISENHYDLQRIFWRDDPNQDVQIYRLTTVTYGTTPASYLATRCLKFLAALSRGTYPLGAQAVDCDFYVDDCLTGCDDLQQAMTMQQEIIQILALGQFELHKWCSNDRGLLETIPPERRESKYVIDSDDQSPIKTLGVWWNPVMDTFNFTIKPATDYPITKRGVLSEISRIFDPLGLLGPVNVMAKIFMKNLWTHKIDWDENLKPELEREWLQFRDQLPTLESIHLPRHVMESAPFEIHGFCDASEMAYGAAIYIKSWDQLGSPTVRILCSKSRVAPLKSVSIPRLELCGALLLAQLACKCITALNLQSISCHLWTDSTVVLAWLAQPSANWKTFVANRVTEIHCLTRNYTWHHVRSNDNPCDHLSRGVMPQEIPSLSIWWEGPTWLTQSQSSWPNPPKLPSDLPEAKGNVSLVLINKQPVILFERFSNYNRLINAACYVQRFIDHLPKKPIKTGPITAEEKERALNFCIRLVQGQAFRDELSQLKKQRPLAKKSKILSLHPFLDADGLIRVGGRLENSTLPYNQKHQIILPSSHHFTTMVVRNAHRKQLHAGPQLLLATVRQKFWPTNGKRLAKKVMLQCVTCFRNRPKPLTQLMGELPAERVEPTRPFSNTGTDFCGPFFVKSSTLRGAKTQKAYVCIFICLATKAVHVELVGDLTTASFIGALKRFVSRRGRPKNFFSDNGTNFLGADREMQRNLHKVMSDPMIAQYVSNESISWHFIPPRAPHFGGIWEAAIKSMKYHLKRVVGDANLTFEEMYTVLAMIECCMNSRPLLPLSDHPHDFSVLTPGHFLTGGALNSIVEPDLTSLKSNNLARWRRSQQMLQHFWNRWSKEYLSSLQVRRKWRKEVINLEVNRLVLIKDDDLPPLKWLLGRIVDTHPGKDGYTRVATIKTSNGLIKRAITKICLLPESEEASPDSEEPIQDSPEEEITTPSA